MAFTGIGDSLGYEQITLDATTARGLSLPAASSTLMLCLIKPEGQAVRWRDDGQLPTATVGQVLAVGAELRYDANNVNQLRFIGQVAGAKINVNYYGKK